MNKFLVFGFGLSLIASSVVFGADFSKSSNEELLNLSGKVEPKDIFDYNAEIEKRIDEMTLKDSATFREKLREQERKVYDNMKVKDFKARQKAIKEALRAKCEENPSACKGHHKGDKPPMPRNGEMKQDRGDRNDRGDRGDRIPQMQHNHQ